MKRALTLLTLIILTACGRPLTMNERAFTAATFGPDFPTERVRLNDDLMFGEVTYKRPIRPRLTCSERIWPPSKGETVTVAPGAMVGFHTAFFRPDLYRKDFLPDYPQQFDLVNTMLFAHEMTHVWQWANRARTGYHPFKGAGEHSGNPDPYLFDPDTKISFLDHGYEQQGAIVEEYVCCRLLDPDAPRTTRLRDMISAEMPLQRLDNLLQSPRVQIPWRGAEISGICR